MLFCNGIKTYVPLVRFAFHIYIFSASFVPHTPFNCHFKRKWFIITIFIGEVLNNSFFCWTFVYAISIKTCNWKSYDCKVVCWTFWNEFLFSLLVRWTFCTCFKHLSLRYDAFGYYIFFVIFQRQSVFRVLAIINKSTTNKVQFLNEQKHLIFTKQKFCLIFGVFVWFLKFSLCLEFSFYFGLDVRCHKHMDDVNLTPKKIWNFIFFS